MHPWHDHLMQMQLIKKWLIVLIGIVQTIRCYIQVNTKFSLIYLSFRCYCSPKEEFPHLNIK
jgi:hypothetical protein